VRLRLGGGHKLDVLRTIPLLAECSRAELEAVARVTDELSVPAGRELMRQGRREGSWS
jgi:hypothetical protein